jgi:hypothetical protein
MKKELFKRLIKCYQEGADGRCRDDLGKVGPDGKEETFECPLQGAAMKLPNGIEENVKALIEVVLEPVVEAYGKPLKIVEGFVCPRRCGKVGNKSLWLHVKGDTALIQGVELEGNELRFENLEIAREIVKNGKFDEMVLEDVHEGGIEPKAIRVSYQRSGGNRQVVKKRVSGRVSTEELSGLDLAQLNGCETKKIGG